MFGRAAVKKATDLVMKRLEITKAYLRIKTELVEWFNRQTGFCHGYTCAAASDNRRPSEQDR